MTLDGYYRELRAIAAEIPQPLRDRLAALGHGGTMEDYNRSSCPAHDEGQSCCLDILARPQDYDGQGKPL